MKEFTGIVVEQRGFLPKVSEILGSDMPLRTNNVIRDRNVYAVLRRPVQGLTTVFSVSFPSHIVSVQAFQFSISFLQGTCKFFGYHIAFSGDFRNLYHCGFCTLLHCMSTEWIKFVSKAPL